jgi:Xaa-Pro aminopeptidase
MAKPYIHFTREEFVRRQAQVRRKLAELGLDGLLLFKIEDMYWLCGLDTDGFCIFHCMFIGANGELTHVTRPADLANIAYSSTCEDVRVWVDRQGNPKGRAIREMLESHGMNGRRIGIQVDTMGLTPRLYAEIRDALDGSCELVTAPDFVRELRLIKSSRELEYLRRAGQIMDKVREVAVDATHPGGFEGEVIGKIYHAIFANDGDPPAHRPPIGNGDAALNVRYTTARKRIGENDQVTFEIGCGYRHYHAAEMFVVLTGPTIDPRHRKMHAACVEALDAVQAVMRAGTPVGELFEAHRRVFAKHGYEHALLPACGYTMGATWPPTWMEQPQIFADNPLVLQENMCFFTHMILVDHETGLTMSLGEQAIVTSGRPEVITHVPREPIIR